MAVLLPAPLVLFLAHLQFFAIAFGRNPSLGDPQSDQIVPGSLSSFGPQRQVVFIGPALVAVTFDLRPRRGVGLEPIRVCLKGCPRVWLQVVAVEIKIDILQRTCRRSLALTPRFQT